MRSINSLRSLANQRVLVRVDFNVPVKQGRVPDDTRLRASLPTIRFLRRKGARVILISHLGRPEGKVAPEFSLAPVARALAKLLHCPVQMLPGFVGDSVQDAISQMKKGDVAMLENIRFSPDEQKNTGHLAHDLASLANVFVLDGFSVAHRADASVAGVPTYLPSYAGILLEEEIHGLSKVMEHSASPFVAILGGIKMETKLPVMKKILPRTDAILVGGGIASTILAAYGYEVGESLVDTDQFQEAARIGKRKKIILPVDVIVGHKDGLKTRTVIIQKKSHRICERGEAIFDIGPETIALFEKHIARAKTLLWNGAMGYFEEKPYDRGTMAIANALADQSKKRGVYSVIGGGETIQSMDMIHRLDDIDLVSTGGGAMLEFLSGKKLPGVVALARNGGKIAART